MGLIAFILFVSKMFGWLEVLSDDFARRMNEKNGEILVEAFDWMHMFVFLFAIAFLLWALLLVFYQIRATHSWESHCQMETRTPSTPARIL